MDVFTSEVHLRRGVGLWLTISDNIVKHFGGTINLKSTEKEGSMFLFTFPLDEEQSTYSESPVSHLNSDSGSDSASI